MSTPAEDFSSRPDHARAEDAPDHGMPAAGEPAGALDRPSSEPDASRHGPAHFPNDLAQLPSEPGHLPEVPARLSGDSGRLPSNPSHLPRNPSHFPGNSDHLSRGLGQELLVGLAVVLAIVGLGAPLGLLWSQLSPRVLIRMSPDGPVLAESNPEEYMGAEAVYTLLGLGAGIALAVLCWVLLRRWRGPVVLVALTIGCLLGAIVTWQLGQRIGLETYNDLKATALVGWEFYRPPTLESGAFVTVAGIPVLPRGALVMQALAAVFTYTMIAGWSRFPGLRPTQPGRRIVPVVDSGEKDS